MLAVLITLTPDCRNEFIEYQTAQLRIAVVPIMDVKTRWNSIQVMLEHAYRLPESPREWFQNPKSSDYWPLFTTEDQWTIVKFVIEVLRPFWYWTLWMSKRHTVTLHHVITVYNDRFDHLDTVKRALANKKTQWKEDLFCAVKLPRQKQSNYYAEVIPMKAMLLIPAHIPGPFETLRSFRKWVNGIDNDPKDGTSYTMQYHEASLRNIGNEQSAKHRYVPDNKHNRLLSSFLIPSTIASRSCKTSFDP